MAYVQQARQRESAVVSIDMVGYSLRMANDAERTIATVKDYHSRIISPAIGSHGGRLIGRAGDSWLVEFTTADAALRFALDVQRRQRDHVRHEPRAPHMSLRTGLNFGDVIEDDDTFHGTGINVAVRLQAIAKPGGITFSSMIRERLTAKLDFKVREIGPRTVKNIPRPVLVYRVVMDDEESDAPAGRAAMVDVSHPVPGLENRPAIAVLPFRNIGNDREQEYFSDGLTEDVMNGLAHFRWFPVISRSSTFQFKNTTIDLREIGRLLGARYIVDGSVRRAGERLRVTAQLTHAEDGEVVWRERYERRPDDLFAVQDDIAQSVAAAIEPELSRMEQFRSRMRQVESLDDWDLVRRGMWHMNQMTRDDAPIARELFEQALARSPSSTEALIQLAWWHFWDVWARRGQMEGWVEMEHCARRAMALDPRDARALHLVGVAELMQGDAELSRGLLQQAVRLNPSMAVAHAAIGTSYILAGEPETAIEPLRTALRLSPNDAYIFHTFGEYAVARYMMGDYALGIGAAQESLRLRPGYWYAHVVRIGCLARLERWDEARAMLRQFRERRPNFTIEDIEWLPFIDRHWIGYLAEGLRLAGFEERAEMKH